MECDHESKDNWPMGGRTPIIAMLVSDGVISAATISYENVYDEKMGVEGNTLIENPGEGHNKELYFTVQDPANIEKAPKGTIVPVEVQFDGYLAAFNETVSCEILGAQ